MPALSIPGAPIWQTSFAELLPVPYPTEIEPAMRRFAQRPGTVSSAPERIKFAADHAESPVMKQAQRRPKTVGLDKPCSMCGAPIHHTYAGPVEGVCGRCTDKRRRKRVRTRRVALHGNGPAPKRRSTASAVVLVSLVMVGGAAAVLLVLRLLLG